MAHLLRVTLEVDTNTLARSVCLLHLGLWQINGQAVFGDSLEPEAFNLALR